MFKYLLCLISVFSGLCKVNAQIKTTVQNDSCCQSVKVIDDDYVDATFKNSQSFEKLIQQKFTNELKSVTALTILLRINVKGIPIEIDCRCEPIDKSNILCNALQKFIKKECRWKPAYRYSKHKKIILPSLETFFIK